MTRIRPNLTHASLTAAYAPHRGSVTDFSYLMAALDGGNECVAWQVLGDSTSNGTDEWVYLTMQWLAARYPTYTVDYMPWNATSDNYDPTVRIQTGPSGERYATYGSAQHSYEADSATNSITGDIDVRAKIEPNNWTLASEQVVAAKFIGAGTRSWRFMLNSGTLQFDWSEDGTNLKGPKGSGVVSLPANGTPGWVRVTLDVDNGASGNDVKFYTSTDGVTWTQVGSTVTTAGVTSIFNSTAELQVAARGGAAGAGANLLGKVYRIEVRNGIGGPLVAPGIPELWERHGSSVTFSGSPVLTVVNGSHAGADIFVLTDATRFAKMTPKYGQALVTMSCSHNDTNRTGAVYLADRTTLLTLAKDKFTQAGMSVSTQNPRTSPATYITEHAIRQSQIVGWANRQGIGVIDAFRAFNDDARPLSDLIYTDGMHLDAAGSEVWRDEAVKALAGR